MEHVPSVPLLGFMGTEGKQVDVGMRSSFPMYFTTPTKFARTIGRLGSLARDGS